MVSCVPHVDYPGDLRLQGEETIEEYAGYTRILGSLVLAGELPEAVELPELIEIKGNLWVWDTRQLREVRMGKLERVLGDILFRNNADLRVLGFSRLREVGGNLAIAFNAQLPTCVAEDVFRQVGEANVRGSIKIEDNQADACDR